jgi:hypothetical protein
VHSSLKVVDFRDLSIASICDDCQAHSKQGYSKVFAPIGLRQNLFIYPCHLLATGKVR